MRSCLIQRSRASLAQRTRPPLPACRVRAPAGRRQVAGTSASCEISVHVAPLSLLPPVLQQWSVFLPFRYMVGFPIDIITGAVNRKEMMTGFLLAAIWVMLFIIVLRWLWKAGLKKNQAVGG